MCACEEIFARCFLPHQLSYGIEWDTRRRVPVTLVFQKGICNKCRSLPEEAHPKAPTYGRSSKIHRYYWREIAFETIRRFGKWTENEGGTDWLKARQKHQAAYHSIERNVIEEIKDMHRHSPKYVYQEDSQDQVLTKHQVEIVRLDATYVRTSDRRVAISYGDKLVSSEEFAAYHFEELGYKVVFTESRPFHALFGVFMWLLIQDPGDPEIGLVSFGDRVAFEQGIEGKSIRTFLPQDFGTPGYGLRRAVAIEKHFTFLPKEKEELFQTFDYWVEHSADLRQYLWVHRSQDVIKAREIISILPAAVTRQILKYLIGDYWKRYCGWPDMIVHNKDEFFFAEVKSSKDKLSEHQKNWIRGNSTKLHLPFKLVKIHKRCKK